MLKREKKTGTDTDERKHRKQKHKFINKTGLGWAEESIKHLYMALGKKNESQDSVSW